MPKNNLDAAISKANSVLGYIRQDFSSRGLSLCVTNNLNSASEKT